jgi:hypothetical protein
MGRGGNFGPAERARARGRVGSRPTSAHERRDGASGREDGAMSAGPRASEGRERNNDRGDGGSPGRKDRPPVGSTAVPHGGPVPDDQVGGPA